MINEVELTAFEQEALAVHQSLRLNLNRHYLPEKLWGSSVGTISTLNSSGIENLDGMICHQGIGTGLFAFPCLCLWRPVPSI
jgi:hypothetical protein